VQEFEIEPTTEGYIRYAIASGYTTKLKQKIASPDPRSKLGRSELKYILQAPYWKVTLTGFF